MRVKSKVHVTGLVRCSESGPGLIGPPVVVLGIRHLHIVAESDEDFGLSQLLHRRPLAQLRQKKGVGKQKMRSTLLICITVGL